MQAGLDGTIQEVPALSREQGMGSQWDTEQKAVSGQSLRNRWGPRQKEARDRPAALLRAPSAKAATGQCLLPSPFVPILL